MFLSVRDNAYDTREGGGGGYSGNKLVGCAATHKKEVLGTGTTPQRGGGSSELVL